MSYTDLVNIEEFEKRENFNMERWDVAFYFKDCKKLVETERPNPQWYTFLCKICESKNVVIWTEEGLKNNYKLK